MKHQVGVGTGCPNKKENIWIQEETSGRGVGTGCLNKNKTS